MKEAGARSLIRRVMFWLTVVIALSSTLVVALIAIVARHNEEATLRDGIVESSDRLARMLEGPLWDVDLERAKQLAEAFASDPRVVRITIRESSSGAARVVERSATTDTVFRQHAVTHNGREVGQLGLALDRHVYHAQIVRDIQVGFAVALLALVTSLIGMRLLLRQLLERPINDLSSVVRSYATGDYSRPAHSIGYGELQAFGDVLDAMGGRIVGQLQELQVGNRDLAALNAVLGAAAEEAEPDELLARACAELTALLAVPYGAAGITNEAGTAVVVRADRVPPGEPSLVGLVLHTDDPTVQGFLAATAPVISRNANQDERLAFMRPLLQQRGISGLLALPLISDGVGFGAIALFSRDAREFSEHELALASRIVGQVSVALARHRAHAAERLLRATIEQIPESVFVTGNDVRVVYVNPAFTTVTGVARQAAQGKRLQTVLGGGARGTPELDAVCAALTAERPWTGRVVLQRDGRGVTCDVVISPVRDARGGVTHHVGIMRDITLEIERDERMRHSQKLEAVGQLAGGVAHDFNNILGAIMLQLEYLETQLDDPTAAVQTIHDLRTSADRASKLPRQLLTFSRRQTMDRGTHDLNLVVGELLRMLRRLIGEGVAITFTPADTPLPFSGDSGMIEQVVMNLCVNARDAMQHRGRLSLATRRVQLTEDEAASHPGGRAGAFARLEVTDTGTGMSDEVLAHIFEPFFTTKAAGLGTGLGLATTHGIITQHEGWIEVQSTVGTGTSFHIYVPVLDKAVALAASPEPPARATTDARILVVEDEAAIRRIVAQSLRDLGYRVLEASDTSESERAWNSVGGDVDLVLTDMVMPEGVSGIELTTRLRKQKPELKVVVMSGYNLDVMDEVDARPLHVHFIRKPFNLAALSNTIRVALSTPVSEDLAVAALSPARDG